MTTAIHRYFLPALLKGLVVELVAIAAITVAVDSASAEIAKPETVYSIAISLSLDGEIIGMPALSMSSGATGWTTVERKFSVRAGLSRNHPLPPGAQPGDLSVDIELMLPVKDRWQLVASPNIHLSLGSTFTTEIDLRHAEIPSPVSDSEIGTLGIALVVSESEQPFPSSVDCLFAPSEGDTVASDREQSAGGDSDAVAQSDQVCRKIGICTCCWSGGGGCCSDGVNCPTGCCAIIP